MNRKEIIRAKWAQKDHLINVKKATYKTTDGIIASPSIIKSVNEANKSELPKDTDDVIYRTIIGNTYNLMDSHEDVHLRNCFKKSYQENKRQLYMLDHSRLTTQMAGKVLKAYEMDGTFKDFGYDNDKETQAFLKDVAIYREQDEKFFSQMKNGQITQHSVGMMYVKISLAIDDVQEDEAYKLYSSILPLIANYKEVEEKGYFFAVHEAKEFETSAVTLGSNPITGVYNDNKEDMDEEKIIEIFGSLEKFDEIYQNIRKNSYNGSRQSDTSPSNKSFNIDNIIY